ncbi:MAG TPA: hypothetical protein VMG13_12330, partial [Trebonia sp.]|nr:hypothetical protein [Trebonia sp.]
DSIMALAPENKGDYSERPLRDSGQLNLRSPEVLSLVGAASSQSATVTAEPDTDPVFNPDAPSLGEGPAPGTRQALPRRIRPDKEARDDPAPAARAPGEPGAGGMDPAPPDPGTRRDGPAPRHAAVEAPAPEAARNLAASLQDSWQRSREEPDSDDEGGDDRP